MPSKRPEDMQHFLKAPFRAAWARVIAPELLTELLESRGRSCGRASRASQMGSLGAAYWWTQKRAMSSTLCLVPIVASSKGGRLRAHLVTPVRGVGQGIRNGGMAAAPSGSGLNLTKQAGRSGGGLFGLLLATEGEHLGRAAQPKGRRLASSAARAPTVA